VPNLSLRIVARADGEAVSIDPRIYRLRVELFTAAQTLKGDDLQAFVELIRDISVVLDANLQGLEPLTIPPVDRSKQVTTDGRDPEVVRLEQRGETGMHKSYIVLSDEERAKGFVRPVRRSYKHEKCGAVTTMGQALAETYARDPSFYGATFCATCGAHFPVGEHGEFVWVGDRWDGNEKVGV
jgi:hypothetical protein